MHVHENSDGLAEDDTSPHDHVSQLTLEEWESGEYA